MSEEIRLDGEDSALALLLFRLGELDCILIATGSIPVLAFNQLPANLLCDHLPCGASGLSVSGWP